MKDITQSVGKSLNDHPKPTRIKLQDWGYNRSKQGTGSPNLLTPSLDIIYADLLEETGLNEEGMKNRIDGLEQEITGLESDIGAIREKQAQNKGEMIPEQRSIIQSLKEKIKELKLGGVRQPIDWKIVSVTAFIVAGLTVYLFLFYSSAIYTVLYGKQDVFASLDQGKMIFTAIFNTEAIQRAAYLGTASLIFVLAFPFVFIGLGFMLHKSLLEKLYGRIVMMFGFTLLLDVLLAYVIAKNIHQVLYLARIEELAWQPKFAFEDSNFYFVIAAGFVVYIIWGFLLDMLLTELNQGSKTHAHRKMQLEMEDLLEEVKACELEIKRLEDEVRTWANEIKALEGEMKDRRKRIENLKKGYVTVDFNLLERRVREFQQGWKNFLYDHYSQRKANDHAQDAGDLTDTWLAHKKEGKKNGR